MGAWGYHPMDSDSAHDLFFPINDAANKELEQIFRKKYGLAAVGLVEMLLKKGFHLRVHIIHKCIEHLNVLLKELESGSNKRNGWRDPKIALKELTEVRDGMVKLIDISIDKRNGKLKKSVRKRDSVLAPRGWQCRDFELSRDASWSGLFDMNEEKLRSKGVPEDDSDMPVCNTAVGPSKE